MPWQRGSEIDFVPHPRVFLGFVFLIGGWNEDDGLRAPKRDEICRNHWRCWSFVWIWTPRKWRVFLLISLCKHHKKSASKTKRPTFHVWDVRQTTPKLLLSVRGIHHFDPKPYRERGT